MSFYTDKRKNKQGSVITRLAPDKKNKSALLPKVFIKTAKCRSKPTPKVPAGDNNINQSGKRAAIFTSIKNASFTVEAALILPFFLLICLTIFGMLNFYSLYVSESVALKDRAEKTAVYAYESDRSPDSDGYLTLTKPVNYKVPYSPVPLPALEVPCFARVHIWCGYLGSGFGFDSNTDSEMVYVTDYESVYHTDPSCSHLDLHIFTKSLSEARKSRNIDGARYHPCEKCIRKAGANPQVYLSERGTAYHNNLECSGLKRNVRLVEKSEVSGLRLCSRCGSQSRH